MTGAAVPERAGGGAASDVPAAASAAGAAAAEPVLETWPVGPPARGVAAAGAALRFYAADRAALPRPAPLDRALWGAAQVAHGARLVAMDPALRRAALLPTALTAIACAALAGVATAERLAGTPEASPAATFHAFGLAFVALASMPPTLLQRMWLRVALEARRALGLPPGEDPYPGVGWARLAARESVKALRQFVVVSAGIAPLLLVVRLLPLGEEEAWAIGAAWAFYWVVVDAYELPVEVIPGPRRAAPRPWYARLLEWAGDRSRLARPLRPLGRLLARLTRSWHEEVQFTERHAPEAAGLGLGLGLLLAIPGVGLFFRAVAIVAATAHVGRLDGPGRS